MITLEDYQQRAVDWLSERRIAMVVAPAGSGKTIIAAAALNHVLLSCDRAYHSVNIGWVANTIDQCRQARKALAEFSAIDQYANVKVECAAAQSDWSDCAVLVIDECHHLDARDKGNSWLKQAKTCRGAIWGFTATPDTDDIVRYKALVGFFDDEVHVVPREASKRRLAPAKVILLDDTDMGLQPIIEKKINSTFNQRKFWFKKIKKPFNEQELWGRVAWQVCVKYGIIGNTKRNEKIMKLMRRHRDDPTLVLVNEVDHGKYLSGQIPGSLMCFSKMGAKSRRESIEAFRNGLCKCLIATSLADEGLDLPMARVLILASGGRSTSRTTQRTGRVLRAWFEKEHGLIYDFTDKHHALSAKHARLRQELYRKLKYDVEAENSEFN